MFYAIFIHKDYSELFLSAHFLFWEILNLHLTFAVYVKLKLPIGNSKGPHHCLEKVGTGSTPTSNITWVGHSKLMKQSNGGTKWRLCPGLLLIKTLRVTLASHLFKASNFIWPYMSQLFWFGARFYCYLCFPNQSREVLSTPVLLGSFRKYGRTVIGGNAIFLLFSVGLAYLDILCGGSFSHHVIKFYCYNCTRRW